MKSWLEKKNATEICLIYSEEKSAVVARFIKIYKSMTLLSKNVYTDKLDELANKYNNTFHRTIKMKPVDANSGMYFDFNKEINQESPKHRDGDNVRISKYKKNFGKDYITKYCSVDICC